MIALNYLAKLIPIISISLIVSACGGVSATDAQQNNAFADSGGSSGSGSASNSAPVISGSPDTIIANGSQYTFTPIAYDADGDSLSFSISNKPGWASFNTSTGTLKGIPGASDAGTTSNIVISVSDGKASAKLSPFNITVTNDNPPVAGDDNVVTDEDTAITINTLLSNDTDPDGDALTIKSITQPTNGVLLLVNNNTVSYTPSPDFNGSDSFTYTIDDGLGGTDTATVYITVNSINDIPVAAPDNATTMIDTSISINVLGNDTGMGDLPIIVSIQGNPSNGVVAINPNGTITYTPNPLFHGLDSFSYQISDANNDVAVASVYISVECPTACLAAEKTINLSWDPSPDPDITGYYLYHGTSKGNYVDKIYVGPGVTFDFVTILAGDHYFAVTAINSSGNESGYSNEVYLNL